MAVDSWLNKSWLVKCKICIKIFLLLCAYDMNMHNHQEIISLSALHLKCQFKRGTVLFQNYINKLHVICLEKQGYKDTLCTDISLKSTDGNHWSTATDQWNTERNQKVRDKFKTKSDAIKTSDLHIYISDRKSNTENMASTFGKKLNLSCDNSLIAQSLA